jgi:putative component of membrane protein insertase Oxa1/YidC/SpoIIIJ protein YidD
MDLSALAHALRMKLGHVPSALLFSSNHCCWYPGCSPYVEFTDSGKNSDPNTGAINSTMRNAKGADFFKMGILQIYPISTGFCVTLMS